MSEFRCIRFPRQSQRGVALVITLIVLVIMTLGAVALVRSIDTSNLIAGNLAFRQSAVLSTEVGLEAATSWLEANRNSLTANAPGSGYMASWGGATGPAAGQTWQTYWTALPVTPVVPNTAPAVAALGAGNTVSYVIQRMCPSVGVLSDGPAVAGCAYTRTTACPGNTKIAGNTSVSYCYVPHYRITVRVAGPRNTVVFVQTTVAL